MKLAMEGDDAEQDDVDIHRYSRLLGIKEGKKSKKLKSFANDGLDCTSPVYITSSLLFCTIFLDLLDFCDSDNRKRILASSADQEISLKGMRSNSIDSQLFKRVHPATLFLCRCGVEFAVCI